MRRHGDRRSTGPLDKLIGRLIYAKVALGMAWQMGRFR